MSAGIGVRRYANARYGPDAALVSETRKIAPPTAPVAPHACGLQTSTRSSTLNPTVAMLGLGIRTALLAREPMRQRCSDRSVVSDRGGEVHRVNPRGRGALSLQALRLVGDQQRPAARAALLDPCASAFHRLPAL